MLAAGRTEPDKGLVRPVPVCSELLGKVLHLIGEYPLFGKKMPLELIWTEGHRKQWHARLFGGVIVFDPVAALAGSNYVLPFVSPSTRNGQNVVPSQLAAPELVATIQAAVVITAEQCPIAQRRCKAIDDSAFNRNDWLEGNAGA